MRRKGIDISYGGFVRVLKPQLDNLFVSIFNENRATIKVKDHAAAVLNLEKICAAVLSLSRKKGFDAMSLRELSGATGLSTSGLHAYFSAKEEIRTAIMRWGARFAIETINREVERWKTPRERLAAAIRTHLYVSEAIRPWFYFAFMEARNLSREEMNKAIANERLTETLFVEILAQGAKSGGFWLGNIELTAAVIKAMLQDWYVKRWKYRESGVSVEQYADFTINFVMDSISSE